MAIKNLIIYKGTNFSEYLYLPLRDYSSSQLAITNITGLEPVNSDINISDYAARDGGVFNSSRKGSRNLVVTMKLFDKPTMDSVRNKVYEICPTGDPVTVVIDWEEGLSKLIHGYIESTPADYFGDQEGIQISIICPDPNFVSVYRAESGDMVYYLQYVNGLLHKIGDNYSVINFSENDLEEDTPQLFSTMISGIDDIEEDNWIYDSKNDLLIKNALLLTALNTDVRQYNIYFAYAATDDLSFLRILSLSTVGCYKFVIPKSIYDYVLAEEGSEWVENKYYYYDSDSRKYVKIESENEFDSRTLSYSALSEAVDFELDTYYKLSNFPSALNQWILVSWDNPSISDDETTYGYQIKYGFLSSPWTSVNDGFSSSEVSIFNDFETPFTSKERAFNVLTKKGTALTEAVTFEPDTYYKLKQEWKFIDDCHGFVRTTDSDPIYFYDKNPEMYKYSNGVFDRSLPLYGFYNRIKDYAVSGTAYVSNMYYYRSNGQDVQVTSSTAPTDWGIAAGKYYRYISKFYSIKNYPGSTPDSDNVTLGGRSRHDVILDYLTYKYTRFSSSSVEYQPGVYYKLLGIAEAEFYGLYNLSNIPIYELIEGNIPDDWGTGYYYIREKMTLSERPYTVYYNDHVFSNIRYSNSIYEYELLTEEPSDWGTNYTNYYIKNERDLSNIYLQNGYVNKLFLDEDLINEDAQRLYHNEIILKNNYILGDENGMIETYDLKKTSDTYSIGKYYIKSGSQWIKVTSENEPTDFYSNNFKYYIKTTRKADYIPKNTIIYYNPILKALEYDHDLEHYQLFLNNPKSWLENIKKDITKQAQCPSGNIKIERGDYISYLLAYNNSSIFRDFIPFVDPYTIWNNLPWGRWIFFETNKKDSNINTFSNDCQLLTAIDMS